MQRKCYYCDTKLVRFITNSRFRAPAPHNGLTRDHLLPKARGGTGQMTVDCCCDCNNDKGRLTVEEYRVVVAFRKGMIAISDLKFPGENDGCNTR